MRRLRYEERLRLIRIGIDVAVAYQKPLLDQDVAQHAGHLRVGPQSSGQVLHRRGFDEGIEDAQGHPCPYCVQKTVPVHVAVEPLAEPLP